MTDTTHETEQQEPEELALQFEFNFYPEQGDEEDEDGMVSSTAVMQTVGFGMGIPKVLIDLVEPDDDEHDAKLKVTVGDLDLSELRDLLKLTLEAVERGLNS